MKEADSDDSYEYFCTECNGIIAIEGKTCPHCGADTSELLEGLTATKPETGVAANAKEAAQQGQATSFLKTIFWVVILAVPLGTGASYLMSEPFAFATAADLVVQQGGIIHFLNGGKSSIEWDYVKKVNPRVERQVTAGNLEVSMNPSSKAVRLWRGFKLIAGVLLGVFGFVVIMFALLDYMRGTFAFFVAAFLYIPLVIWAIVQFVNMRIYS